MLRSLPIIGGFYKDPNRHWSAQDTLNVLPVPAEKSGTETQWGSVDVPGKRPFAQFGNGPLRGARNVEDKLLAVMGNQLYQVTPAGVAIPRGTIPGVGRVSLAHNQFGLANQVAIDNGSSRYIYNTQTNALTKVTDASFPGSYLGFFIDGYLTYIEPQGRFWGHSDLADGFSYNTLDSYEAESQPDRIVSGVANNGEVLIFGRESTDIYINSPTREDGFGPFQRAGTSRLEVGAASRFTPKVMANTVFFLDHARIVRRLDGYTPARISTKAIEDAFAECTQAQIRASWSVVWEDRGHKVYYLTVPGKFTFGYDVLSGEWSRRAAFGLPHWPVTEIVRWQDKCIAGSSFENKLYVLDWDYSMDEDQELVRERVTGTLSNDRRAMTMNSLEILANVGSVETVAIPFPEQPDGPSISGEAPDGYLGEAYTYTYTTTPGDAPIVGTTIDEAALLDGLSWDEATATISGTPTEAGTMAITPRVTDANGLWDELDDEVIVLENWLLVAMGVGASEGPFSRATIASAPEFDALPSSGGADLSDAFPAIHGSEILAIANTSTRRSTDGGVTWETISGPFASGDASALSADCGPDGWLVACAEEQFKGARLTIGGASYSNYSFTATRGETTASGLRARKFVRYDDGYYWTSDGGTYLLRTASLDTDWEIMYAVGDGGTEWSYFYDTLKFNGARYAIVRVGVSYRWQIRRSNDGGATWPDLVLDVNAWPNPIPSRFAIVGGNLLCVSNDATKVWTSADDFAAGHATGISTTTGTTLSMYSLVSAGDLGVIISGYNSGDANSNMAVTTTDGITFSSPVPLGIANAKGIAARPPV